MYMSLEEWELALKKEAIIRKYLLGKCDRYNMIVDLIITDTGMWILIKGRRPGLKRSFNNFTENSREVRHIVKHYFGYPRPVSVTKFEGIFTGMKTGRQRKLDFFYRLKAINEKYELAK